MTSVEYPHLVGEASKDGGGEGVTHFVVYGEDGRRVGLFVRGELHAFKQRMTDRAANGETVFNVTPATVGQSPTSVFERFRIQPVDGAGNASGEPEEWTPPPAA